MTERAKYLLNHVEVPIGRIKEEPKNFSGRNVAKSSNFQSIS